MNLPTIALLVVMTSIIGLMFYAANKLSES